MDKNKIAVSIFNKLAQVYQDKFMNVDMYGGSLDFFCTAIKNENAAVLELACGPGNITRYLLNKKPGLKIVATDLAPNMIALAKVNNPAAEFKIMDCRDILSINNIFDAIMCGFCLPYLYFAETEKLIHDAAMILHPDGLLYLSTMEDAYSNSNYKKGSSGDEIFMHFYEEKDLATMLIKNGFTIIYVQRIETMSADGIKVIDLIMVAKKTA